MTGPQAHIGNDIKNGVQLAVDDANAAGITIDGKKIKLELVSEDDEANPTKAATVAQKLAASMQEVNEGLGARRMRKRVRRLDHAAIFLLIAGGYTPLFALIPSSSASAPIARLNPQTPVVLAARRSRLATHA